MLLVKIIKITIYNIVLEDRFKFTLFSCILKIINYTTKTSLKYYFKIFTRKTIYYNI